MLDHPGDHANYFEPFDLGTALITVHKDSSQYRASLGKAAFSARIHLLNERVKSNDDFGGGGYSFVGSVICIEYCLGLASLRGDKTQGLRS
jgi:hypothetical protein